MVLGVQAKLALNVSALLRKLLDHFLKCLFALGKSLAKFCSKFDDEGRILTEGIHFIHRIISNQDAR